MLMITPSPGSDERSQPKAYAGSTGNLPNQGAGTPRRELVGVGRRDDDYDRKRRRWFAGLYPDRRRCRSSCFAGPAAPTLFVGVAVDFGQLGGCR